MVIVIAGDETVIREQVSPYAEIIQEESPRLELE